MNVLSAEGLRCDSAGAELGDVSGCCDRKQQGGNGSSDGAGCACPPSALERAFGDRYLMGPALLALPFETTLRCKSPELGVRDAVCGPRQSCLWGVLLPIAGVAGEVSEAPHACLLPGLCHPLRARSGWKFKWVPKRCGWQEVSPHCSPLPSPKEREHLCVPSSLRHSVTGCCSPGAALLPECFPAHPGMACCLRINNLTDYEGMLADTVVPVKSNCL